jgi:leader peptidase (prepilin peptidase)/N-methyltransferase
LDPLVAIAFLLIGLALGSFLNVCISRIPRDESIVTPRSHCPSCNSPIAWRDNIPLLSWVFLRGRCRSCGSGISLRYPAVELLTGLLFIACYVHFGLAGATVRGCLFSFLVVGLIFMDAETGLLPAEFTYPGIGLGILFAWLVPLDVGGTQFLASYLRRPIGATPESQSLLDSLAGIVVGAGFFCLAWAVYYLVRKRDGLGFGDIAFMAMIGAFLGLKAAALVIFLAPVAGTIFALGWMLTRRATDVSPHPNAADSPLTRSVPFGVFLGASALVALFFSPAIWEWYLGQFH